MSSSREYVDFVVECLGEDGDVRARPMMGEYVLYYRDKVAGGVYDDRLLIKPTPSAAALMPDAEREVPYEGAREMLLVHDLENRELMRSVLAAMYDELPEPRKRKMKLETNGTH